MLVDPVEWAPEHVHQGSSSSALVAASPCPGGWASATSCESAARRATVPTSKVSASVASPPVGDASSVVRRSRPFRSTTWPSDSVGSLDSAISPETYPRVP